MAIDPKAVGATTEPMLFEWTDRDTLLYALGVGAGLEDLSFTTENSHGIDQQVLPTYAVICCPAFGAAGKVGSFNWAMLLYGSQGIRLHAPLPAIATILMLFALFYHMALGLQVVIEDYVHTEWSKLTLLVLNKFIAIALGAAGIFAVLRIALGS